MKFTDGIALFSEGNQHHANQFSDFRSRSRGPDSRKRRSTRRYYPCNRSRRYRPGACARTDFEKDANAMRGTCEGVAKVRDLPGGPANAIGRSHVHAPLVITPNDRMAFEIPS